MPHSISRVSTELQHCGKEHRLGSGLIGAVEASVTFETKKITDVPVYSRLGNTSNHAELEALLAHLHGSSHAIATGSGMSAFTLIFMTLLKPGDHVLVQDICYGGTFNILTKVFKQWGIESTFASIKDWPNRIQKNTKVALFESISNPFCIPQDLKAAIQISKKNNLISICDNTFASPILCKPFLHGADLVIESATKYLNGHSDVIAGMVAGRTDLMEQMRAPHAYLGTFLPPQQCAQLIRGIKTLELRMNRHSHSGAIVAKELSKHTDLIAEVFYGSDHQDIKSILPQGFGGMISVRFQPQVNVKKLMYSMKLISNVPSLGGTETTATMPSYTTNWFMTDDQKHSYSIDDQLVRFSIGLEDPTDLVQDIVETAQQL